MFAWPEIEVQNLGFLANSFPREGGQISRFSKFCTTKATQTMKHNSEQRPRSVSRAAEEQNKANDFRLFEE
jgi:hypothetical protein